MTLNDIATASSASSLQSLRSDLYPPITIINLFV